MTGVTEIADGVFRISTFVPETDLTFNQFVVRDEQPLLFHTGMRGLFAHTRAAVAEVIDPAALRWIGFSHFEADECGALAEWQALAPRATAFCSVVAKHVSVDDVVALRPARGLEDGETIETGARRFRFLRTPHVPHGWDAGLLFEETDRTLFCSDLLYHHGDVEPRTTGDVVGRFERSLLADQQGPFADPYAFDDRAEATLRRVAALEPATLATMHGSSYAGDGRRALEDCGRVLRRAVRGAGRDRRRSA